jgi:hypothetical protein
MNVMHRGSTIALLALLATACADQNMTNESSPNDLSKPTPLFSVAGASVTVGFELLEAPPWYTVGPIHGQDDWSSLGAAGSGCALYDHQVVANTYGYTSFGGQSLRLSNAVTSGCFGDQTFSKRTANYAGETTSDCATFCQGSRQNHFEAEWDFASTVPGAEQPGLSVVASPDRGDGSRMSWVQMTDTPNGIDINFFDVRGKSNPSNFVGPTKVATGLNRAVPHTIKITMDLFDGPSNDVVKVYVDGLLRHTGTSWENYFRYDSEAEPEHHGIPPIVNRILFRTGGEAAPATLGNGFVIDNFSLGTSTVPGSQDACKTGGWQSFFRGDGGSFKNQGDCIQYTNSAR